MKRLFAGVASGIIVLAFCLLMFGCAKQEISPKESALTPGMAKKYIRPGETNQTEVLEIFGPPDLITYKESKEVWTYEKISQEISIKEGFLTIFFAGAGESTTRTSSRSVMLIIYFDEEEIVEDYKLSVSKF